MTAPIKFYSMQVPDEQIFVLPSAEPQKSFKLFKADSEQTDPLTLQPQAQAETFEKSDQKLQIPSQTSQIQNVQKDQANNKQKGQKEKLNRKKKKMQGKGHNKEDKKDKFYCKFYMQGSCKNGASCKFTHPVDVSPVSQGEMKKGSESKQPFHKMKKEGSKQSQDIEMPVKLSKQIYFERMIDTMKEQCFGCKKRQILVALSCGCHSICELCVKGKASCSKDKHVYDNNVYIK